MRLAIKLHVTDQTGKGNKDIVRIYGKDVFEISENLLSVNIPYNPLAIEPHDAKNDAKNDAKTLEERIIDIIVNNNKVAKPMLLIDSEDPDEIKRLVLLAINDLNNEWVRRFKTVPLKPKRFLVSVYKDNFKNQYGVIYF